MKKTLLFLFAISIAIHTMAQLEYQKIYGEVVSAEFGKRVVIEGDIAASFATHTSASVQVFRRNNGIWEHEQTLYGTNSRFGIGTVYIGSGSAMDIEDGKLFIGEWDYSDGNVYVYAYNGTSWELEQTIYHEDNYFGKNLSVDGDLMMVNSDQGMHLYHYDGSSWVLENSILGFNSNYGQNLLIKDSLIVIRDNIDSDYAPNNGAVHLYEYDGTDINYLQKLNVSTLDTNSRFGGAMAIEENTLVIGAEGDAANGVEVAGRVFIFENNGGTWELLDSLSAGSNPVSNDRFGCQVEISGGEIYVGESAWGNNKGRVQKFSFNGSDWDVDEIRPSEVGSGDYYSRAMSFDGKNLMVGAHFDDDMGTNDGAAYIFDLCTSYGPDQNYTICQGDSVLINSVYYSASTSVEERLINAAGCDSVILHTLTVLTLPNVTANADMSEVCEGESVTLYGSGTSSYTWNHSVVDNVTFTPSETLTYTVTGSDGNCENTDQITITVHDVPMVVANASETEVCYGTEVNLFGSGASTYTWSHNLPDNTAFTPTSTNTYTVTGSNGFCEATDQIEVIVNDLPIVVANADASEVCEGESVTLYGSGANTYTWDHSIDDNVTFTPIETLTYTVTGSDGICENTDQITITVNPLPNIIANADMTELCAGESVVLYGSGANTYTWDNLVEDNIAFIPTETMIYTVTGTDGVCENTDQIEITVTPLPIQPSIVLYGGQLMSSATDGNQWYYTSIQLPGETNQMLTPQSDGLYYVEVTVDGCSSMSEAYNYSTVDVEELNINDIKIYPTIVKAHLYVDFVSYEGESLIQIMDTKGQILKSILSSQQNNVIQVDEFAKGTYLIRINQASKTVVLKWIKE